MAYHPGNREQETEVGLIYSQQYEVITWYDLSQRPFNYYLEEGYQYLVVSSDIYDRYLAEPDRYAENVAFYQQLWQGEKLLQECVLTGLTQPGPVIQIYQVEWRPKEI